MSTSIDSLFRSCRKDWRKLQTFLFSLLFKVFIPSMPKCWVWILGDFPFCCCSPMSLSLPASLCSLTPSLSLCLYSLPLPLLPLSLSIDSPPLHVHLPCMALYGIPPLHGIVSLPVLALYGISPCPCILLQLSRIRSLLTSPSKVFEGLSSLLLTGLSIWWTNSDKSDTKHSAPA